MPISLTSLFLGFVIGAAVTAFAWNLTQRTVRNPESTKMTGVWSVKDVAEPGTRPAIIAQRIQGVDLPAGSKVIIPTDTLQKLPASILETCDVRMHPDVRMNAAIGRERALLFNGVINPQTHAVATREHATVRRLQDDFQRMWGEATPYVERVEGVSDLAGKSGRIVEVAGRATEVLEYRGRKMLRITDGKTQVGVVTDLPEVVQYQGRDVRVTGRMKRDGTYAFIEADQVVPVQPVAVPA